MQGVSRDRSPGLATLATLLALAAATGSRIDERGILALLFLAAVRGGQWFPLVAPLVAAGWLLAAPAPPPRGATPAGLRATTAQVAQASRRAGPDHRRALLVPRGEGVAFWLYEPTSHPVRLRGDVLSVRGSFRPPRSPANPGDRSDRHGRLLVEAPAQVKRIAVQHSPGRWRDACADLLARRIKACLSPGAGGLAQALFLDRAEELEDAWTARLQATGTYHLVAVSGFHIGLVGGAVLVLLSRVATSRLRAGLVALAVVCAYTYLCGARPPAVRAALLFGAYIWQRCRRRPASTGPVLGFAFLVLAACQPEELARPGLQLSFAAVLGISVMSRYGHATSPRGTGHGIRWSRPLVRALKVAAGATLATAPLSAWHFGTVAPLSPLATLLLGPLLLPFLLVAAVALLPVPFLAASAAWLLERGTAGTAALLDLLDRLPATPAAVATPSELALTALLGALALLHGRRPRVALLLVSAAPSLSPAGAMPRRCVLLDVGHGQALLIQARDRTDLLDAGGFGPFSDGAPLRRALRRLHVHDLGRIYLSHLDADHASQAPGLVEHLAVREILLSVAHREQWRDAPRESVLGQLRARAAAQDVPVRFLHQGQRTGPFEVLWPPRERRFASPNEGSLVLQGRVGGVDLLAPGDLEGPLLAEAARACRPCDVLVLPHHGNPDPHLPHLLEHTRPLVALASRGTPLPPATVRQLRAAGIAVCVTETSGALVVTGDPALQIRPYFAPVPPLP